MAFMGLLFPHSKSLEVCRTNKCAERDCWCQYLVIWSASPHSDAKIIASTAVADATEQAFLVLTTSPKYLLSTCYFMVIINRPMTEVF